MRAHRLAVSLAIAALCTPAGLAFASQPISNKLSPSARAGAPISAEGHVGAGPEALRYVPGELIVQLKDSAPLPAGRMGAASALGASSDSLARVLQRAQARDYQMLARPIDTSRLKGAQALSGKLPQQRNRLNRLLKLRIDGDVNQTVEDLRRDPDVQFAEPNYIARASFAPNDPYFASSGSWGQTHQDLWGLKLLNLSTAWDTAQGRGIVVAVVDSGLDAAHEDIAANVWRNPNEIAGNGLDDDGNGYVDDVSGWDFVEGDNLPQDGNGHGTHVAGTIAAVGNNGIGIVGVAPQAKILPVRGLNDSGNGNFADLIAAVIYAADAGAHVINNSWGGEGVSVAMREAMDYARDRGSVVIAAAGNDNKDVAGFSPANIDSVISVGALHPSNAKAGFSNFGSRIDVYAPGEAILSLAAGGSPMAGYPGALQGKYIALDGTSMAAPHVAGIVALALERFPTLTPDQVRGLLRTTATDIGASGWDSLYGFGTAAPVAALQYAGSIPRLRASITSPSAISGGENHSYAYGRDRFTVAGTVGGPDFASFEVAYAPMAGDSPTAAFTLLASGQSAIGDSVLGEFDATDLPDGRYMLRVRSRDGSGRGVDAFQDITKDSSLLPGWPLNFGYTGSNSGQSVLIEDLDGDGTNEIIANSGAYLFAWNQQGEPLPGFPKHLGTLDRDPMWGAGVGKPSVGDLDGDGDLEIVVHVSKRIYRNGTGESIRPLEAFHHTGEPVAGFPAAAYPVADIPEWLDYLHPRNESLPPVIADLDGDGHNEIVLAHGSGNIRYTRTLLTVVGGNGKTKAGWPKFINTEHHMPHRIPVVGDLDGDGLKEIVVFDGRPQANDAGNPESRITVYGHDGLTEARRVFPHESDAWFSYAANPAASVVIADINADGRKELVVTVPKSVMINGQWEPSSNLHVMDSTLTDLPGWPRSTPELLGALITNVDADPGLEFVALKGGNSLQAFDSDGSELPGYPAYIGYATANASGLWNLVEGGLEVAGSPIFVTGMIGYSSQTGRFEGVVAFDKNGQMLPGYPKNVGIGEFGWPAAATPGVDSATIGYMTRGNTIFAFRHTGTPRSGWTKFQGDNAHTGEDARNHPPQAACQQFTATNPQHVTAGRAYKQTSGSWFPTTTYYANGSNENLGASTYTQVTLSETAPGHFKKGACTVVATPQAPQVTVLSGAVDAEGRLIAAGKAWDADGDLLRVEVQLNAETTWRQASGTGNWTLNLGALGNGPHTLKARAVDAGGRVSAVRGPLTVQASEVVADRAPTVDSINSGIRRGTVDLYGGASDPDGDLARVEFQLDGGAWQLLTGTEWWSATIENVAVGMHTVVVRATDLGGRTGTRSATFEVIPDIAPVCSQVEITLDGGGLHYAWMYAEDVNYDLAGGEFRVDNGEWKPAFLFFGVVAILEDQPGELAVGPHTFHGRVHDSAGLQSDCPPTVFEVAPPAAPTVDALSVGMEGKGSERHAYISGQASDPNRDIARIELELNGDGNWFAAEEKEWFYYSWMTPPAGTHTVRARAVDSQGLVSPVHGPVSFDAGPGPSMPRITAIEVLLDGPRVTVRGNAADGDGDLDRVEVEYDGNGQWRPASGTAAWTYFVADLGAGNHSVRARAFDKSNGQSDAYGPIAFTVGAVASAPVIDSLTATVSGQQVTVSGTASDADGDLTRVEVEFNGSGQWLPANGSASFSYATSSLPAGNHSVRARGVDAGNRAGTPSAPASFTIAAPTTQCFTAANAAHASAGRATLKYVNLYYANGTNDYLGMGTTSTSLQQQGSGWKKVTSCP